MKTRAYYLLIVKQFESGRLTWSEDERYRNLAAYHEAKRMLQCVY